MQGVAVLEHDVETFRNALFAGFGQIDVVLQLGDPHARGPHADDEQEPAYRCGVVSAMATIVAGYADQSGSLVVAQGVGADVEMRGRCGDVPVDGAGVADQFPQGVEVHTAWRIDGQAQRVGEVLLIHESNARG